MPGQVIVTKLRAPSLRPGLIARSRLAQRLAGGARSRLILVSAPAGFGKTTLLAEWAAAQASSEQSPTTSVWLSLDPEDAEPFSFWTCVVAALESAVPQVRAATAESLALSPLPTEHLLTALLNTLAAGPQGPDPQERDPQERDLWLVLDDYHLAESPEVSRGLAYLLDHLPAHVHLVLITRSDPDLPLARWRARGELTEIRAADLRFSPDEAADYLADAVGPRLTPAQVAALEARTEGWAAALQLAALSLRDRDDVSGFVARFAGDDRYVVDYLVEEVLEQQPRAVREFLLRTAVLDRLTGTLCDNVIGEPAGPAGAAHAVEAAGAEMLVRLERANLFLVPLDDRREWFRYHHLFADVLRARLLAEQPELVPLLHGRAADWFETQDRPGEAIRHAAAGRDFGRAARLIELAVPAIRRDRQEGLLIGWLNLLPDKWIRRSPVLSVFTGYRLMLAGDLDAVEERLSDAERALSAIPDGSCPPWAQTDDVRTLPATIAIFRASLAQARGGIEAMARHARQALELAGPDDHLSRGGASGFLALAAWTQGEVDTALDTFSQAVAALHASGNVIDELNMVVTLGDMWLAAGRPDTARRVCEQALRRAETGVIGDDGALASAAVDLHVALSELDREAGDLDAAEQHLERAQALGERGSRVESRYRWFVAKALLVEAQGDPESAITLLDEAERLYRPGFFPELRPIPAIRARVSIGRSDLDQAAAWAAARGVSVTDDVSYLSEYDQLTLVRLRLAQHQADASSERDPQDLRQIATLLGRLHELADGSGRVGSLREIERLQESVAQSAGLSPAGSPSAGFSLPTALSDREREVLRLLAGELSGPQIARELFVSHNTLRTHTKHIFTKLEVTSRRAAVRRAQELGLL